MMLIDWGNVYDKIQIQISTRYQKKKKNLNIFKQI